MIRILKASAGSGKTFRLAKTYISLLLGSDDRYAYRHILAVTFTNKATDEMKRRILKELDILSRTPEESGYIEDFRKRFGSTETIRKKARRILLDILHDYSVFSVSTIDKFFQLALKAFAREIGQFSSYQVELDKDTLVRESVDRILDAMTASDKALIRWLTDSVMENLEQGGRLSLENSLYETAIALKSDEHRELMERAGLREDQVYSKEHLTRVRDICRKVIRTYTEQVRTAAETALHILDEAGVSPDVTRGGFMAKLRDGWAQVDERSGVEPPTDAWIRNARDSEKWFTKPNAPQYLPRVAGVLDPALNAFCDLFGPPYKVYRTALILRSQLYSLGIAGELYQSFDALLKEKNVMSIDDSNSLLRKIIGESDAPFIYEKLGVRFEDFLLDEFQDTSTIQWENFAPLLAESEAAGRDNLVVGDIKQSIYRWRGSDWNLLASRVKERFPRADDGESLRDNWRSLRTVVQFNNAFYPYAAASLDRQCGGTRIAEIYADVAQQVRTRDQAPGHVCCTFCPPSEQPARVLEAIRGVCGRGASYGQIAVLVRGNAEGSALAAYLIENGIPVVSDDSLKVKSSVAVRRLVSLLSLVDNPGDTVGGYLASRLGVTIPESYTSLVELCEDLLRMMQEQTGDSYDGQLLYIQSFLDDLQDWTATSGNHLSAFLRHWTESDSKISSPDDADAVRILTIHKAKGLEFPFVIFPYAEKVGLFRPSERWTCPPLEGTALDGAGEGAYRVSLSDQSRDTLFQVDFERERQLQYIDNINTFYVATTRAVTELQVIAALPSEKCRAAARDGADYPFKDFSQLLWHFLQAEHVPSDEDNVFCLGEPYDYRSLPAPAETVVPMESRYRSWPADTGEGPRLKLKYDSFDFFGEEGRSERLKGILLHDMLAGVRVAADVPRAVERAVQAGDIDASEREAYLQFLSGRIAAHPQWFPDDGAQVRNEVDVIAPDGTLHRPDRVVLCGGSAVIIDYKFGEARSAYRRQLEGYAALYRALGYPDVTAWLWYLTDDRTEQVV